MEQKFKRLETHRRQSQTPALGVAVNSALRRPAVVTNREKGLARRLAPIGKQCRLADARQSAGLAIFGKAGTVKRIGFVPFK